MTYKNIPFGAPEAFNVVIEIPEGSQNKYEYDEELDLIKLDWVFKGKLAFPFNYGYIPHTRGGDGDHLDVFVIAPHSIEIGAVVKCRAIGMLRTLDRGEQDDKLIAVPLADPASANIKELSDLGIDYQNIFEEFYAELAIQKKKIVEITGYLNSQESLEQIKGAKE